MSGLSGALGGGASLLFSLVLTALARTFGYFQTMKGAYTATIFFVMLGVAVTLALGEHAAPTSKKEDTEKKATDTLFGYRHFTALILQNLFRGFATGVVAMAVTIGYACELLDAKSASIAVVITGGVSLLGALSYAAIATRMRAGRLFLISGIAVAFLLPTSVFFKSTALYLILYGISYFFVIHIDHSVPVAITQFVDYDMISRYTGGRMLLHTLGMSFSGLVSVGLCRTLGPIFLMLATAAAMLAFAVSYYLYLKKLKL